MVINGYGLLWYFFTLAAGASFMWIYLYVKSMMRYAEFEEDFDILEDDYDTAVVTVNNKYYEVPKEVATSITAMNKCAEMLATDLALKKKKDATDLFIEYFSKAKESIEK